MRDCLDECNVRIEHIAEAVVGVSGGADAEYFHLRALRLDLSAQVLEVVDRVLDGVPVRELVGLAENIAVFGEKDGLGRGGSAVETDEAGDGASGLEGGRGEGLGTVL